MDCFEKFGEIIDLRIDTNKAFITFSYFYDTRPEKDHEIQGTPVILEPVFSQEASTSSSSTVAIIGDIEKLSGDSLRNYLDLFGTITDFRRTVNRKTHKMSRCIFVKFDKPKEVDNLLSMKQHRIKNRVEKFDFEVIRIDERQ